MVASRVSVLSDDELVNLNPGRAIEHGSPTVKPNNLTPVTFNSIASIFLYRSGPGIDITFILSMSMI